MYWDFSEMEKLFSKDEKSRLLAEGNFGVELESQRVTASGELALTPHPPVFGDKTVNPRITTDFSESQVEMITPVFQSVEEVFASLQEIYEEVESGIWDEMLWPLSMPPRLPDEERIPIARFSDTREGREKEVYRNGLALRHGKKMQMISGIHYNFSFSERMLDYLYEKFGSGKGKREFINDMYFGLSRNFLRYHWLLIYLFGASPFCDSTYHPVIDEELKVIRECCPDCCNVIESFNRYAASLRVSRFGYSNTLQRKYNIYFNSLDEYIGKLKEMRSAASPEYLGLGLYKNGKQVQLNENVLQKESEFYSCIRLKQNIGKGETQLKALEERGVKYVEVRILDLNPFEKLGISLEQLHFLQVFMLYCLFEQSGNITPGELRNINTNHHLTALFGRKKDLFLYSINGDAILLKSFGERIFERLRSISELMDKGTGDRKYRRSVEKEYQKLLDRALLPSEKMYREMRENNESFLEFGIRQAVNNSQKFNRRGSNMLIKDYAGLELSTQILIKEALDREVKVDVIDHDDNFIRLKKGDKVEYVKQATRTSADTYIAPLIMENKEVTKKVLKEHGINVPEGITVKSAEEALEAFPMFLGKPVVIKPKSTNFGKGVIVLKESKSAEDYEKAVRQALEYDSSVLVEEFIPGKEYRFLVIGDEVQAVLHRVPANVVGDGAHTIEELVNEKNKDPLRGKGYVTPLEKINLGKVENEYLAIQGKDIHYVPKKGEAVYLRENSNISTGGDSIDFTDELSEKYKTIAVKSAKAVGAKICGADIIIRDIHEEPDAKNHSIIELNFNPALHIHDFPYKGQNRHVEEKVLDLLGFQR